MSLPLLPSQEEAMYLYPGPLSQPSGQSFHHPLPFHHPAPPSFLIPDLRTVASAHNLSFTPIFTAILEDPAHSPTTHTFTAQHPVPQQERSGQNRTHTGSYFQTT